MLEIDHQLPGSLKFLHGDIYQAYSFAADLARRRVPRRHRSGRSSAATSSGPYRIRIKTKPEDAVILGTFLVIAVTGFVTEAFRIALDRPARRSRSGRSSAIRSRRSSTRWSTSALSDAHRGCGSCTSLAFLAFLVILPTTKLRHMFTSPDEHVPEDRTARRAR